MTKAEEFWLKFTEERRAEQDALDAIDKDPVAKAAKAAKEAEEEAARGAKREKRKVVQNRDNSQQMLESQGGFVFAYLEDISGIGGTEVPGFIPTRYELIQIVKVWCKQILDVVHDDEVFGSDLGPHDTILAFGKNRIKRIETILGEKLFEQAEKDYKAAEARMKKFVLHQQEIAVLRSQAVKVEKVEFEVRYTYADDSVLVTHEGDYGETSFSVEHWFSTTAEKEAFDADMAERNLVRWGIRKLGSGHMVRRPEKPAAAAPPEPLPPTGDKPVVAAAPNPQAIIASVENVEDETPKTGKV